MHRDRENQGSSGNYLLRFQSYRQQLEGNKVLFRTANQGMVHNFVQTSQ
uniref:Uncharacterized protein n=1 Tax=Arundo donax TaxID=35708 RepID=A0A0A9EBL7_ARUDO